MYKMIICSVVVAGALFLVQVPSVQAAPAPSTVSGEVSIEKQVRTYFADIPVMIEIARCESNFRQFTDSGLVLRGGAGGGMIGIFQFYEQVHAATAGARGLDLATTEGNLGYARYLYERSGTTPWLSAKSCWTLPVPASSTVVADLQLRIELLTKMVGLLQQLLALQLALK